MGEHKNISQSRIVFFGTPEIAAFQLEYLIKQGFNIVGVVTTPDRPMGRGRKLSPCAVKTVALKNDLPVLEPQNLKSDDFNKALRNLDPDLQIVVAFRMLPEKVWALPKKGTINLHASLLPQYRGAAPINHVIINGEEKTGVSTFLLQHAIDTGAILLQREIKISETETAGTLHDKIMHEGGPLLAETINKWVKEEIEPIPQDSLSIDENKLKQAPKIFKEDCRINFRKPAEDLIQQIRGLSPYPTAFTAVEYQGKEMLLKIYDAEVAQESKPLAPGILKFEHNSMLIGTKTEAICVKELQISGKQRMKTENFIRGIKTSELLICP